MFLACTEEPTALIELIPDEAFSASSFWIDSSAYAPYRSRLDSVSESAGTGAWAAGSNVIGEWIGVDLQTTHHVSVVATRGRDGYDQWVTNYQLKYSLTGDEADFEYVTSPQDGAAVTFAGNTDRDTIVKHEFGAILARYFRLYPTVWYNHISLRWELYSCISVTDCPEIAIPYSNTNTSDVSPGATVSVSCDVGFSFGGTHNSDELIVTCSRLSGEWNVDLTQYNCTGKIN